MSNRRRNLQREETSALLNDNQVADFKAAFDLFDTDKDKKLTATDLRTIMKQLANFKPGLPTLNPEKFDAMFKEADTTGAGSIEFAEFMSMMSRKMRKIDPEETLRMAFKVFDHNNTGRCKATELREALMYYGEKMTEAEWNDMTMGKIEREGFIYYEDLLKEIYGDRAMTTTQ